MRQKMIEFGYSPLKIFTLPNAYFGQTQPLEELERDHIFFSGRLSPEKGIDLLVRAAKNLNISVNIAGDGPERNRLAALAEQIGASNVKFLGFLDADHLNHLYQTALVTVLPSRWYENGPLVLLEILCQCYPGRGGAHWRHSRIR